MEVYYEKVICKEETKTEDVKRPRVKRLPRLSLTKSRWTLSPLSQSTRGTRPRLGTYRSVVTAAQE
jgi:hypothetical protein